MIGDTEYVLPRGVDPYWQDFGSCYGYELLPEAEQPVGVGPSHEMWKPGRPRPGFAEGLRETWTDLPEFIEPSEPRLPWQALGDLRRCVRWASDQPDLLKPEVPVQGPPQISRLLRLVALLHNEIERASVEDWPVEPPAETAPLFESMKRAFVALSDVMDVADAIAGEADFRLRRAGGIAAFDALGAFGPPPEPYDRARGGRPARALLVVHAAHYYYDNFASAELTPQDLAMIVGLEGSEVKFGGSDTPTAYLRPPVEPKARAAQREGAVRYWRDRIRDYRAPTTNAD